MILIDVGMHKIKFRSYNKNRPGAARKALCHAPAGSVLFTPSGNAQPCHYNRGLTYGKYPEQSVKTIFESEKRTHLLKTLKSYRFPKSCYTCEQAWKNKQQYNIGAKKYDGLADATSFPELLELQIDNNCPLECVMCSGEYSSSIRKNREHEPPINTPYDARFVEQLLPCLSRLKRINFTGGEPLLIPLYYDIMEQVIEHNPSIEMNLSTNASVLPKKFLHLLPRGNFSFTVSIDSMNKNRYETIRKNAVFEQTMKNIDVLLKHCKATNHKFSIKACILTLNYHDIPGLLDYWNNKKIEVYIKPVWFPPHLSLKHAGKKELGNIISSYEQYQPDAKTEIQKHNQKMWLDVIQELKVWYRLPEQKPNNNMQNDTLENMLSDKIRSHLIHQNITEDQAKKRLEKYNALLQQTKTHVKNKSQWHQAASYLYYTMPVNLLINELEHGSAETFAGRIAQTGLFDKNILMQNHTPDE
ncbi:MAG: radical SAM protein [Bacteroidales bacterium]